MSPADQHWARVEAAVPRDIALLVELITEAHPVEYDGLIGIPAGTWSQMHAAVVRIGKRIDS